MNFLQLVQRVQLECGVSGAAPATVVGQPAEINRLVKWVNSSWIDIQNERQDWEWMRGSCSFVTIAAQATYTPVQCGITDFGAWDKDSFRNYETAAGSGSEIFMDYIDYETWRDTYQFGSMRTSYSRPMDISITPLKALALGQVPTAGYTIVGDYFKIPSELALDADIPAIPTQYHMAIVYGAMLSYGGYEAASEVYQRAEIGYKKIMRRLRNDQLPDVTFAGALA